MPRIRRPDNRGLLAAAAKVLVAWTLVAWMPRAAHCAGDAARGRLLFAMAGGCGCHTGPDGPVGAGGGEVPTPFGTFYGSNITPDRETGIGAWTDEEIAAAVRGGWLRDGSAESPAMPYYRYAAMTDADLADLIAYLRALPPVRRENKPHAGTLPLERLAYRAWRFLFARGTRATPTATDRIRRGRYLVDHVAICGDCHTPRTRLGASDDDRYLAGTRDGPAGIKVPNITPHRTGIGDWDESDIVGLLRSGMRPDFDNVQGLMAEVVDGKAGGPAYKDAAPADLEAIAAYLKTIAPVEHSVRKRD
jgi:mono/diheme cytochrome c family protein